MRSLFKGGVLLLLFTCGGVSAQTAEPAAPARQQAGDEATRPPTKATPRPAPPGTDEFLHEFIERYAWIVPSTTGSKATLGCILFLSFAFLISVAARIADVEHSTFGRCCVQAILVFAIIALHTTVTFSPPAVLAAVAIFELVMWFVAAHFLFSATPFGGLIMLVSCFLGSLVMILLLEVAASVLQMTGKI